MPLRNCATLRRMALALLAVICAMSLAVRTIGAAESYSEDAVEGRISVPIHRLCRLAAATATDPQFTIAVLDADGVASELERLLQNRQIQNRPAQVRSIRNLRELDGAQMLYIGGSHREELRR